MPADARQTTVSARNWSAGHAPLVPSQASSVSHVPADALHGMPAGKTSSTGQYGELPEQDSSKSQAPADGRQTLEDGLKPYWHWPVLGLHRAVPQTPRGVHTTPAHKLAELEEAPPLLDEEAG